MIIVLLKFMGIIAISAFVAMLITVVFVKALSKLFANVGSDRRQTRSDSQAEVYCINCFDKSYERLKQCVVRVYGVFKRIIEVSKELQSAG